MGPYPIAGMTRLTRTTVSPTHPKMKVTENFLVFEKKDAGHPGAAIQAWAIPIVPLTRNPKEDFYTGPAGMVERTLPHNYLQTARFEIQRD